MNFRIIYVLCLSLFLALINQSSTHAAVSEGETVRGMQSFEIPVTIPTYEYDFQFELGSLCVEVDDQPLNKFGLSSITLGGVEFTDFGASSDFSISASGCTHRLRYVEDVESFDSVQFRLNTALLSNGDHQVKVVVRNDADTCLGDCIPDYETYFSFTTLNVSTTGPVIYFNPELFNCADCLAIGLPYSITATFGTSSWGSPTRVSSHLKLNGLWQNYAGASYKNKKWVLAPITIWGDTWVEVKASFKNGKSWYYKQLLRPRHRFSVSGSDEFRVGRVGSAKLSLPGVNYARCVVEMKFYPEYGLGRVRQFGANLYSGRLTVTGTYSTTGTLDGYITCRVNGEEVIGIFGWDVTYW